MEVKEKITIPQEIINETKDNKVLSKRDISIDFIRVIACFSVILTHLCLQVLNQCYNRIDWSRLLEKSFFTDGVPLFFMITGFFLVNGRSYKKMWKSAIKKILLPTLIFVITSEIFYLFIVNKESILYCIQNIHINIIGILQSILKGDVSYLNSLCAHLWYIYSYIKIIIWIPILWLVCKEDKNAKLARRIMMILSIAGLFLEDVQRFWIIPVIGKISVMQIIPIEILYVLLGYELFVNKEKIKKNKKLSIACLIGYFIINFLRYRTEMQYMVNNSLVHIIGRDSFMEWRYTCFNVISGLLLFMFLYSFEIKNEKISKIILWISNKTFGIYLIHYLVLAKIDLYKFEKIEKFYLEIIYLFLGLIVTLVISILIIMLIEQIKKVLVLLGKKVKLLQ